MVGDTLPVVDTQLTETDDLVVLASLVSVGLRSGGRVLGSFGFGETGVKVFNFFLLGIDIRRLHFAP